MTVDLIWDAIRRDDFEESLRLSVERIVDTQGIDTMLTAGLSLMRLRHYEAGLALLKAAVALQPSAPYIYSHAAAICEQLTLADEVEFFAKEGLRFFPDDEALRRHRGNVYLLRMDYPNAIAWYQALLRENPADIRSHVNLGNTFRLTNQLDMAERHMRHALHLMPDHIHATYGLAIILAEKGDLDAAITMLERISHVDTDAQFSLALNLLARGDYRRGWDLHRQRWNCLLFKDYSPPPRSPLGLEEVRGQTVLVAREQGFGDVFQFMRYLPLLASMAHEVIFGAQREDRRILDHNLPNVRVVPHDELITMIKETSHPTISMLDLPYYFGTTLETIPAALPYIAVPASLTARRKLPAASKRRVGLVWAGGETGGVNDRQYNHQRSIALSQLAPLAAYTDQIEFVSLQMGSHAADEGLPVTRALGKSFDWADTAAIVGQLDLVIAVCTGVAHLSAAMGIPTWVLSRANPCWRWLRNQPDSPWYPGVVRVFGQKETLHWGPTIEEVEQALAVWLEQSANQT